MNKFDVDDFLTRREQLLSAYDYADIECNDCIGCENSCCREISGEITLDSWDIALLKEGLGKTFDELISEGRITINEVNGAAVPIFASKPDKKECVFLKDDGRCSIHPYRAGICRMYPLARLWQGNGNFAYYLQKGECVHRTTARTRVSDWLGYSDVSQYESAVRVYHAALKEYRMKYVCSPDPDERKKIMEDFFDSNFR